MCTSEKDDHPQAIITAPRPLSRHAVHCEHGDRTQTVQMTEHKLLLQDAASVLGITPDALRQRIRRGQYRSTKEENRVYVYLNDDRTETEHDVQVESSALIYEMRERVASLERQLNEANDRDRENRRIIAGLTQRIPELPAADLDEVHDRPSEPARASETPSGPGGPSAQATLNQQQPSERRPWY